MQEDVTPDRSSETPVSAEFAVTPANPSGYELLEEVGHGGMGVVYRARDTALDRDVAVKVLADRYSADCPAAQRFLNEARITGQLQHPSIPAVHQVGTLPDGRPFLAMKLIKGATLDQVLRARSDRSPDLGRLLAVFEATCQAVGYAHAHQVIHRDLKPANVMVGAFGEVQVMDWGLAKVLGAESPPATPAVTAAEQTRAYAEITPESEPGSFTRAGSLMGTAAFVAPEQAAGELEKVNERADVFGLAAILTVILTGKPPYVDESFEAVRLLAVRGKLDDCLARLDACGAEPGLVALCKRCLAFEPQDRPRNAGEVARAVAELRSAAEARARSAEREQAAAAARSIEQRRRRRWQYAAAGVVGLALAGGILGLLVHQRAQAKANAELAAKNAELAEEQAKAEARFEMARKAIATFHTGVSEDMLLKNDQFKELRTKLLQEAAGFYADLEKLLAGQTDVRSRKTLAAGYSQLGELTEKIGSQPAALTVHRKALALRRELAAAADADLETRLDVARSLGSVGELLHATGDSTAALAVLEEQRNLSELLAEEDPTDAVRAVLALSHHNIGFVLQQTGKPSEALAAYRKSLTIRQELGDANPAITDFQRALGRSHHILAWLLEDMGKPAEALTEYQKALAIRQKLVNANPAVTDLQRDLSASHNNMGALLMDGGKPAEALAEFEKTMAILQKLAEANPAVNQFLYQLALAQTNIGILLSDTGKPAEALAMYQKALAIMQRLADANPAVSPFQISLAQSYFGVGKVLMRTGKLAEALATFRKELPIVQKLVDANPAVTDFKMDLVDCLRCIGRLHALQQQFAEGFTALDLAVALGEKLTRDTPSNPDYTRGLGNSHADRGMARVRALQPAEAAADLRRAVELLAKYPTDLPERRLERSRSLALLAGLGGKSKSGVTTAEAKTFADQSVAVLRDAIRDGWGQLDKLKEPDFDSLRSRDDFKSLVAELEKRAKAESNQPRP
jgi:tetratricopeptide (TPR) repeat protein